MRTADICERERWASGLADASKEYDVLDRLASRAELFGNYLGEFPRDALATYGEFLEKHRVLVSVSNEAPS